MASITRTAYARATSRSTVAERGGIIGDPKVIRIGTCRSMERRILFDPVMHAGTTGVRVTAARRATPPRGGRSLPLLFRVPSGKINTAPPEESTSSAPRNPARAWDPRCIGMALYDLRSVPNNLFSNSSALATKWTARRMLEPTKGGSQKEMWLQATMTGPFLGTCSRPST